MPIKQLNLQCAVDNEVTPHNQETPNHVVHALVSLFLIGIWIPVWIVIAISATSDPVQCVKCGNKRPPTGPAVIWSKVVQVRKPTSTKMMLAVLGVLVAAFVAIVIADAVSG